MKKNALSHKPVTHVRMPLGIKLVIIVTLITLGAVWTVTAIMSALVSGEFRKIAEEKTVTTNSRCAMVAEEILYKVRSEALFLLDITGNIKDDAALDAEVHFFERINEIVAVVSPGEKIHMNQLFFRNRELDPYTIYSWLDNEMDAMDMAARGRPVLRNPSPAFGAPLLAMFFPWQERGSNEVIVVFFLPDRLADVFGDGLNSAMTIMVNETGDVCVHPDVNQVLSGVNMADFPLLEALNGSGNAGIRQMYNWEDNRFYGSGRRLSFTGASVLSSIELDLVTNSIRDTTRRNILVSVTVLFLVILITWFFSRTITYPINRLIHAFGEIEQGTFPEMLKSKTHDELGLLTDQFNAMCQYLKIHEQSKNDEHGTED